MVARGGVWGRRVERLQDGASRVMVTGYVLPHAWDAQYQVCGVLIADDEERELVVDNINEHMQLLHLCRCRVSATGQLYERDRMTYLELEHFLVIDDAVAEGRNHVG